MTVVADSERAIAHVNLSGNRSLGGTALDPFLGVASLAIDAIMVNRGFSGIEVHAAYLEEAKASVAVLEADTLTLRPLGTPCILRRPVVEPLRSREGR